METVEHIIRHPKNRIHETPLLFQHGAWHSAWCWELWMDHFSSLGYETHAISLPGHGKSSLQKVNINAYSFADYVDVFASQVETISPTPVSIGHSLGGAIVQKYLENHQLPGAVLVATVPASGMLSMIARMFKRHPLITLSGMINFNLYNWVKTPALARENFLNEKTSIDTVAYQKQLVNESSKIAQLMLPFAKVSPDKSPMLVINGGNDALFTIDEGKATAGRYNAKYVVMEGQPHNLMMESGWEQTANVIDHWITHELELS